LTAPITSRELNKVLSINDAGYWKSCHLFEALFDNTQEELKISIKEPGAYVQDVVVGALVIVWNTKLEPVQ
jgi:hypothetical protein